MLSEIECLNLLSLSLLDGQENLDISGRVWELDTTDFERIDYEGLYKAIEETLKLIPVGMAQVAMNDYWQG
jgi:hypothetical protein